MIEYVCVCVRAQVCVCDCLIRMRVGHLTCDVPIGECMMTFLSSRLMAPVNCILVCVCQFLFDLMFNGK